MATDNPNPDGQQTEQETQLSAETLALAEKGRNGGGAPAQEFRPQDQGKPQRPETVPEKFWDAEKGVVNQEALLKSYLELEKTRGTPPAETQEETPEAKAEREKREAEAQETPEQKTERERKEAEEVKAKEPAGNEAVATAITAAQEDYAANGGELSAESREALVKLGIPEPAIDAHLVAVKAQEAAIRTTAEEAAGGIPLDELMAFGATLDKEEIELLNAGLANPKTLAKTVQRLAADYRTANPGEGRLRTPGGGGDYGDVYTSKDEYLADMKNADKSGDAQARVKAIQKLQRSRKAGTVKSVTPRSGPFRG